MLNELAEVVRLADHSRLRPAAGLGQPRSAPAGRSRSSLDARGRPAGVAVPTADGVVIEKRVLDGVPPEHDRRDLPPARGPARRRLELRPRAALPRRTTSQSRAACRARPAPRAATRGSEIPRRAAPPALPLRLDGRPTRRSCIEPRAVPDIALRASSRARLRLARPALEPRPLPRRPRARRPRGADRVDRAVETVLDDDRPTRRSAAELDRRQRLLERAAAARAAWAPSWCSPPTQFVVAPPAATRTHVRARAAGDDARSVIAGYHWFTDWGRDTMISLEGLTLCTSRLPPRPAGSCAPSRTTSATACCPTMFPEGANEGLYHTADATLWFFHALDRYLRATGDAAHARRSSCRCCARSSSTTCAARGSASASIRPTGCCARARRATS